MVFWPKDLQPKATVVTEVNKVQEVIPLLNPEKSVKQVSWLPFVMKALIPAGVADQLKISVACTGGAIV